MEAAEPRARAFVITPPGEGGIGIIAMSGPGAAAILDSCFRATRRQARGIPPGAIAHGRIVRVGGATGATPDQADQSATVDEVIVAHFDAASSFTGEDTYEVNCHGGVVAVQAVLNCLQEAGAKVVPWRSRAEDTAEGQPALSPEAIRASALGSLPRVQTRLAAKMLLGQAGGALCRALETLRRELSKQGHEQAGDVASARSALRSLLATAPLGRALLTPPAVALAGPPNAGKSTLLNALLRRERVIVHHLPGTTRDVVRETVAIEGVPFELVDSAGIRDTVGKLEGKAVRRATDLLRHSDVLVLMYDVTRGPGESLRCIPPLEAGVRKIVVGNKIDLVRSRRSRPKTLPAQLPLELDGAQHLLISAREGKNIKQLEAALLAPYRDHMKTCDQSGPMVFSGEVQAALERVAAVLHERGQAAALRELSRLS